MNRLLTLIALAWLAACEAPTVPDSAEACRVERLTSVPIRHSRGLWVAEAQVNGKPVVLMLDTGATNVSLLPEAVKRLGVREDSGSRYTVMTGSGPVFRRALEIDELRLGGETVKRLAFPELEGAHWAERGYDGILGMSVFARYDVEIDFPGQALNLYRRRYCPSGAPPWQGGGLALPIVAGGRSGGSPVVPAALDGRAAKALLDTGATLTIVDNALARRVGGGAEVTGGRTTIDVDTVGDTRATFQRRRFQQLTLAGANIREPLLWVGALGNEPDLLLGLDLLGRMRIWISNGSNRVYLGVPPAAK
jgi:clan AA aspartic protease (TIGR02281 family)